MPTASGPKTGAKGGGGWTGFLIMSSVALVTGGLCYWVKGEAVFWETFRGDVDLLTMVLPQIAAGMVMVGFLSVLLPPEPVARHLGSGSGMRGLLIATAAGALTPGGPWNIFPVTVLLSRSGADLGACVAYVTAWSLIGVQRLVVWELLFMEPDIALLRYASNLLLPLIAGALARRFLRMVPDDAAGRGR